MTRTPFLAAVVPALMLAACGGTQNRGLESVHQPVVSRTDYALDLATSGSDLAPGEAERLRGWLHALQLGYGDRIAVDDPTGQADGARAAIAEQAARYGVLVEGPAPLTIGGVAPGAVRVVVTRTRAEVPGCPDFSRVYEPNFGAHTGSNHGCAINSNLAAMVARPEDLVRGAPGTGTDAAVAVKAIDAFRKAPPTGTQGLKDAKAGGGSQ